MQTSRKRKLWVMLLSASIHWPWEGLATALGLRSGRTAVYTQSEVISRNIIKLTPRSGKSPVSLKARDIFRICLYLMSAQKVSGTRLVLYRPEREGGMVTGCSMVPSLEVMGRSRRREQKFIRVSIPTGLEAHSHIHASLACVGGPSSLKFIT